MHHGLNNSHLYSAFKLYITFNDEVGQKEQKYAGTCFFVAKNKILHLITNRHNLEPGYKDSQLRHLKYKSSYIEGRLGQKDEVLQIDINFISETICKYSQKYENDIACITLPHLVPRQETKCTLDMHLNHDDFATELDFQGNITVLDRVAFPGYPRWQDVEGKRPIFRSGTIASDPRFNYTYKDRYNDIQGDCIAYEALSSNGNSGGPVFSLQKGSAFINGGSETFSPPRLIGINAGHFNDSEINYNHSGMSYFFKSTAIADTIMSGNLVNL